MRKHFRVPPFAKNSKDEAPILLVMPAKSKGWATRHPQLWWLLQFESGATRPAHP